MSDTVEVELMDKNAPRAEMVPASGQLAMIQASEIKHQVDQIQRLQKEVMIKDEHYGVIPGCKKPSLLKPGAEKLRLAFSLAVAFDETCRDLPGGHREYKHVCRVTNFHTGQFICEGVGLCSTMETKYRFRKGERSCPDCGVVGSIIKGKAAYGGGWLCWQKKGGCGTKWANGAAEIEQQEVGQIENPNIADLYNTVLKMSKKRAFVDAMLTATAASDIFTQDIEDAPATVPPPTDNGPPPRAGSPEWQEQMNEPPPSEPEPAASPPTESDPELDGARKRFWRAYTTLWAEEHNVSPALPQTHTTKEFQDCKRDLVNYLAGRGIAPETQSRVERIAALNDEAKRLREIIDGMQKTPPTDDDIPY